VHSFAVEKDDGRLENAKAFREFVRTLRSLSAKVYRITAANILECLQNARLNECNATSTRLAGDVFRQENSEIALPEELSNRTISKYLANAGGYYAAAAMDYVSVSDFRRAFKYFRRASRRCFRAAELDADRGSELWKTANEYANTAAFIRQHVARRSLLRKKLSFGLLARLR